MYATRYALDEPLHIRYWRWITGLLTGDLGYSMLLRNEISILIGDRLLMTMVTSIAALILSIVVAIPVGMFSAIKQYTLADYIVTAVGFLGLCTPGFLLALLYLFISVTVFGANTVAACSRPNTCSPRGQFPRSSIWLSISGCPCLSLVPIMLGMIRVMRTKTLDVLSEPYIETARMKGLSEAQVQLRHVLRVASNPIVSSIGLHFPSIISGSTVVAMVLTLPTLGPLLLDALLAQDMYLAGTILVILTSALVVGNFLADITLALLDPRIRYGNR